MKTDHKTPMNSCTGKFTLLCNEIVYFPGFNHAKVILYVLGEHCNA